MKRLYLLLAFVSIPLSCKMNPDTELTQFPLADGGIPFSEISNDDEIEEEEQEEIVLSQDLEPPVLITSGYNDQNQYIMLFDEPLADEIESPLMEPAHNDWELLIQNNQIILNWLTPPLPVEEYKLSLTISDLSGNSNWFILPFWTCNPDQADLLINEATPAGSGNNPDCLEFFCTASGSLEGFTLYNGTAAEHSDFYSFPEMSVQQGDYLILHCRPEFLSEEINECTDKTLSGGLLASDNAWDLWCPEDMSLPGTNAIISLYTLPQDGLMEDCLIYTNRTSAGEEEKYGWTNSIYKQLLTLEENSWTSDGDFITPDDALWGDDSTGTRSLCRSSSSSDSNSAADWHTVPTGEKSFGRTNSDEVYE